MNLSDPVILKRLLQYLPDPFKILGVRSSEIVDSVAPQAEFAPDDEIGVRDRRTKEYTLGRIRYFRDLMHAGEVITPIEVDNRWSGEAPCGLVLLDGHHRLCAAIVAGCDHVVAAYSGEVEALRWLTGERATCPAWLAES